MRGEYDMKKTTHKRGLALLSMLPTAVMAEGENKNTIYTRYVSSNSPTGSGTLGEPNGSPSPQDPLLF